MTWAEVFPGEDPGLTVTVTAPTTEAVTVLKPDRAYVGRLRSNLTGPDGRLVPTSRPNVNRMGYRPENYMTLDAGRSYTLREGAGAAPPKAGEYRLEARFQPTPDPAASVERQLKLTCRPLLAEDVVGRAVAAQPPGRHGPDSDPTVEFLAVRTDGGHTLFYRKSYPGLPPRLVRLWAVSGSCRPAVRVIGPEGGDAAGTVVVTYDHGGTPVVAEVSYTTGQVLKEPVPALAPTPRPTGR